MSDCAPARFVKPLEKEEWAVGVNAGGPLINFFNTILPIPFSSVYAGYGVNDRLTVHAGLHTTSLIFKNLQIDAGGTYLLSNQKGKWPGISVNGTLNGIVDLKQFNHRLYPSLAGNFFYDYKYGRFYGGMEQWLDLYPGQVPDGSQYNPWVPAFYVGQTIKIKKWEVNFEYKNLGPFSWNKGHVVRYARTGDHGANGLYVTLQKRF
ncbi:hypothetical protein [Portibacter marinus]|uniref:hypothetical protein n=1 Tax=Portibacter marinus TaxID=2898660 RepID=UPI001F45DB4F|nr:hypothetical protein [Portibacter marinus]